MQSNSPLLINESPLQVLPTLACLVGLNQAIVIQQVHYWLTTKDRKKRPYVRDGRRWVYNSYQDWQADNFPFWSTSTVERIFIGLETKGLLISEQFEKMAGNARKYYSVDYDKLNALLSLEESEEATPSPQSEVTPSPQSEVTPSPQSEVDLPVNLRSGSPQSEVMMTSICGDHNKETETNPKINSETTEEREAKSDQSPANADALSGLFSILIDAYRNIIRTPRDQTDLSWQVSQLHGDGVTVQELQEWLRSRKSLSAIRFIAQDFRLWRENLIRDRERRNAEAYVGNSGNHSTTPVSHIPRRKPDAFEAQPGLPERTGQWGAVLDCLDRLIGQQAVNTWFAPLELVEVTGDAVTLRAINPVFRDWIETNFRDQLLEALTAVGVANQDIAIVFEICRPAEEQAA